MQTKTLEKLTWILVYSGMLLAIVGWFLRDTQPILAWVLMGAGLLDAIAGIGLIYWRSRVPDSPGKEEP